MFQKIPANAPYRNPLEGTTVEELNRTDTKGKLWIPYPDLSCHM